MYQTHRIQIRLEDRGFVHDKLGYNPLILRSISLEGEKKIKPAYSRRLVGSDCGMNSVKTVVF